MSTYIEGDNKSFWFFLFIGIPLIIGAIISTAIENKHEAEAEQNAYNKNGCVIYKEYRSMENVPIKCNNDFVEHDERIK